MDINEQIHRVTMMVSSLTADLKTTFGRTKGEREREKELYVLQVSCGYYQLLILICLSLSAKHSINLPTIWTVYYIELSTMQNI